MSFNIDLMIILGFLVVNLAVGLYYSRNVRTLKDYAIGNRNFNTSTLTATIIATWISGSSFAISVAETYKEGLWFIISGTGEVLALLLIGRIVAPRIKQLFGQFSVAECMGNLYGRRVRIITAIAAIAQSIGFTVLQIKVFSTVSDHFFGIPILQATVISSLVVIIYSSVGGIRAVAFTNVLQFFTFGVFISIFYLFVWQAFGNCEVIVDTFTKNPRLDPHQLFNLKNSKFFPHLFLLCYFIMAGLNPTMFQRILMAKDTKQVKTSFTNAAILCLILHLFSCFAGIIIKAHDVSLNSNDMLMYITDHYSFPRLKSVAVVGILVMTMSTAGSWINTAAVISTNDLMRSFKLKAKREVLISRVFALAAGIFAIVLATITPSLLDLVSLQANFYMPIVTVPLVLAIFGFRTSTKAVLIGMSCGATMVIFWHFYAMVEFNAKVASTIPAMLANLVGLLLAHYLHRINTHNIKVI